MKRIDAQERMRAESNAKSWTSPLKNEFGDAKLIYKLSKDMQTLCARVYLRPVRRQICNHQGPLRDPRHHQGHAVRDDPPEDNRISDRQGGA
jgi:hypothetical protein